MSCVINLCSLVFIWALLLIAFRLQLGALSGENNCDVAIVMQWGLHQFRLQISEEKPALDTGDVEFEHRLMSFQCFWSSTHLSLEIEVQ